jgi:TP901 family phage tail tape measure protein
MMGLQAASLFGVIDLQDNFTNGVRNARNSLDGSFGTQATLYTAPLAAGLGLAAKAAIDFEYQFADVIKTVDATDEQLADLNATIRTMATDNSNPLSSLDNAHATLAEIMSLGGQLGVATENLESFTQHIGALDVASNLNADEAATQLAQFSNVVQMAPEHYGNFASSLVRLGNNLASTEADMMNMTSRIASAGSMAGLSEVQILGFAGAMSSLGINAELGGGNFSKFIMTMQTGVAEAGDDLTTFAETAGMTVDDFAAAWETDAAGAITKFLKGLGELDAASQLGVMKDLELNGVEVQRVILSLAGSTGLLTDALELSAAGWEAGNDHLEEAASKAETTQGMLNMLQNQATDLSIELGNALLVWLIISLLFCCN